MKLYKLINQYVTYRRSLGEKFQTNDLMLRAFCRAVGKHSTIKNVSSRQVKAFIQGSGPVTSAWHIRFNAVKGFYTYAVGRNYVTIVPLPKTIPRRPPAFIPYIYSYDELRKLLEATKSYQRNRSTTDPRAIRTILLLLYGTGLRGREALDLNCSDIDFKNSVLTVHDTKFFKTRLVPFGPDIGRILKSYSMHRFASGMARQEEAPFFATYSGQRMHHDNLNKSFQRIRKHAGVKRFDEARYQPRLHDLRHTFAVHRVTTWYHQGKDVQRLLPHLSVYLGHAHLAATQVYLSMTPELLEAANKRFEYYLEGNYHDYS
jgi:site-specific recombinase XerD